MKVLIVTSFFPTSESDDVPQFLYEQVLALATYNPSMEIFILTTTRKDNLSPVLPANVVVQRFSYMFTTSNQNLTNLGILPAIKTSKLNIFQVPLLFIFEFIAILKFLYKHKPDYIYSHWFLPQGILCHIASVLFRVPHLFTSHSYDVEICKKLPLIGPFIVRVAIRRMQAITVVSTRTLLGIKKFFKSHEWNHIQDKFEVLPMGISSPISIDLDESNCLSLMSRYKDKKVIVFMGRFVEKKGIGSLLKSFSELSLVETNVILVLAGSGTLKTKLMSLIQELDLIDKVELPGFISKEMKAFYLTRADLFVLPSVVSPDGDREGLPVSLLESMSYGNICIATEASGACEIIDSGVNGFIYNQDNEAGLLSLMKSLLNYDRSTLGKIKIAAKITSKKYQWENIIATQYHHFFGK
jgi:glycosyltransferase involved in cell wall biosynthesis